MTPQEPSEGAQAAVDALIDNIQDWMGRKDALRHMAARTVRLARGTTSEGKAMALLFALNNVSAFPRMLTTARTQEQSLRDQASSQASGDMLARMAEGEPSRLIDTRLD